MLGCWDMPTAAESTDAEGLIRRGSGKDCEADYVITQDEFSAVDDYCKITKVKRLSKTAYEVAADCGGEGGEHESNVSVFELRNDKLYITVVPKG
jgi:hypothetical protein